MFGSSGPSDSCCTDHYGWIEMEDSPLQLAFKTAVRAFSIDACFGAIVARVVHPATSTTTPIPVKLGFLDKGKRVYLPSYHPRGLTSNSGTSISSAGASHSTRSFAS